MNNLNNDAIFQRFIDEKGEDSQLILSIEEISELTQAITKYMRHKNDSQKIKKILANLIEEISDCKLMLDQLEYMFRGRGTMSVNDHYDQKLNRALNRLDSNSNPE